MYFAPKAPPEKRRGMFVRFLQTLGLGGAATFLLLVVIGGYFLNHFYNATPQQLYQYTWQTVPQFAYDPAALKDWDSWKGKFDSELKTQDDAVGRANEMLESLNDPFTHLHSAEEVRRMAQDASGQFAGIGIVMGIQTDGQGKPVLDSSEKPLPIANTKGYPTIERVMDGGPAAAAGMQAGDALVSADGKDLAGKNLVDVIAQLKGEPGSEVDLVIDRNGTELKVHLTRALVSVPAVTVERYGANKQIGYIRLDSFEQTDTVDEMRAALTSLDDAESLILDLRGNPGGSVDICIRLVSLFIDKGDVVKIRQRIPFGGHMVTVHSLTDKLSVVSELDEDSGEVTVSSGSRLPNMSGAKKVVILVNGGSASASEMFSGALKDNGRAVLVGEKTFGKGIGQLILPFFNGTALRITTLRYYTPSGLWVGDGSSEHHGIEPNFEVKPATGLKPGTDSDNQLQFAIELLEKK